MVSPKKQFLCTESRQNKGENNNNKDDNNN